jgi:hypothetical protein
MTHLIAIISIRFVDGSVVIIIIIIIISFYYCYCFFPVHIF